MTNVLNTKAGMIGAGVLVAGVVLYFFGRQAKQAIGAAADSVGGVVSGNNALTEGTPYEGWGIFGTLGAATNTTLGGVPEWIGSRVGGAIYDVVHLFDPNQRKFTSTAPATRAEDKPGALRY